MSKVTVVIAEDNESMRASVRGLLADEFDIIGEASDGIEAVDLAESLTPDAIVMDVSMPRLGGIEAARRLRQRGCRSAVVFLSVHRQRRIVHDALLIPDSGYVSKSDAGQELADAVRAVTGGASYVSRSLER